MPKLRVILLYIFQTCDYIRFGDKNNEQAKAIGPRPLIVFSSGQNQA
jgi:hypothetical protein